MSEDNPIVVEASGDDAIAAAKAAAASVPASHPRTAAPGPNGAQAPRDEWLPLNPSIPWWAGEKPRDGLLVAAVDTASRKLTSGPAEIPAFLMLDIDKGGVVRLPYEHKGWWLLPQAPCVAGLHKFLPHWQWAPGPVPRHPKQSKEPRCIKAYRVRVMPAQGDDGWNAFEAMWRAGRPSDLDVINVLQDVTPKMPAGEGGDVLLALCGWETAD